jgi:hypothetical protein
MKFSPAALLFALLCAAFAAARPSPTGAAFISSGGFPAGTLIASAADDMPIEEVRAGDRIIAFSEDSLVQSQVRDVYEKRSILFTVRTERGRLVCTQYQQLLSWKGFIEAGKLKPDDEIAYLKNGRKVWTRVISAKAGRLGKVYNLETGPPHTYIAGGYFAHN